METEVIGGSIIMLVFIFGALVFGMAGFVFWIWSIIDCAQNEPSEGNDKVIWIIVILILQLIGSLLYVIARRPERIRKFGR